VTSGNKTTPRRPIAGDYRFDAVPLVQMKRHQELERLTANSGSRAVHLTGELCEVLLY